MSPDPEKIPNHASDPLAAEHALVIDLQRGNKVTVAYAAGEVDCATVPQLAAALARYLADGPACLILDLQRVTFIDCAGVTALLEATHSAENCGTHLRVIPGRALMRLSAVLQLGADLGLDDQGSE